MARKTGFWARLFSRFVDPAVDFGEEELTAVIDERVKKEEVKPFLKTIVWGMGAAVKVKTDENKADKEQFGELLEEVVEKSFDTGFSPLLHHFANALKKNAPEAFHPSINGTLVSFEAVIKAEINDLLNEESE